MLHHKCTVCFKSTEFLETLAKKNNGKCLDSEYKGQQYKYEWECAKGHRWFSQAAHIKGGSWCPACAVNYKKDFNWLLKLAKDNNGICLARDYINSVTKYEWECKEGHRWFAVAAHIANNDAWCPVCAKKFSRSEKDVFNFVKKQFPEAISNIKGVLDNKRFELDIYIPSLNKAIEFDRGSLA